MAVEQRVGLQQPFHVVKQRVGSVAEGVRGAVDTSGIRRVFTRGLSEERQGALTEELAATVTLLNRWGQPWALTGSHALGVWEGKFTREYKDIDIVTYASLYPSLWNHLLRSGYSNINEIVEIDPNPLDLVRAGQEFFIKTDDTVDGARKLDVFLLTPSRDGKHLKSPFMGIPLPANTIDEAPVFTTSRGEEFRIVPPSVVLLHKLLGAKYCGRKKDRRDAKHYLPLLPPEDRQELIGLRQEAYRYIPKDWHMS